MGNSNGWAESRRYSLDLKPDSDNANVGKYMSEMIGFCVRAPCFLCELGAPLFTDADRRRMIQIVRCFLYHEEIFLNHRCPGKESLAMVKINGEEKQLDGRNLLFCWWISTWWM